MLDSGANKTVSGLLWLECYLQSLSEEDLKSVTYHKPEGGFLFGDSHVVMAEKAVTIPIYIGHVRMTMYVAVVNADIPLLFSGSSMRTAKMKLDFEHNTVSALGQVLDITITSTGHSILPLSQPAQSVQTFDKNPTVMGKDIILHVKEINDKKIMAEKIHRQFAHAPAEKLLQLVKNSNKKWPNDQVLHGHLKTVADSCKTCQVYKKPAPRPSVGLPMATHFLDVVAMDLKFYHSHILIYCIDHATRLSISMPIKCKQPKEILQAIFTS